MHLMIPIQPTPAAMMCVRMDMLPHSWTGHPLTLAPMCLQEMKAYLRNHPQLAQKALKAGVSVAQQNPAVAAQVRGCMIARQR